MLYYLQHENHRVLRILREWGIIPMPKELLMQMMPSDVQEYLKRVRSRTVGRINQEKNRKMKSLDYQPDKHKKIQL